MDPASLRSALNDIVDKSSDQKWQDTLAPRKKKESEFHDRYRDCQTLESIDQDTYEKIYGNLKYYEATTSSTAYLENWIHSHVRDKVFLDYGSGNGETAIKAAKAGAKLSVGIDCSLRSCQNARSNARKFSVSEQTCFVQADLENTLLPDSSVDVVVCQGVLHHLDLSFAFPELRRILAPGGIILAVEALDYNPAIRMYRRLTPDMRTDWEKDHILNMKDIRFASRFFKIGRIKYFHIASILGVHMKPMNFLLEAIDTVLTKIPVIQRLAWIFTFELMPKGAE